MTNENCAVVFIKINKEFIFRYFLEATLRKKFFNWGLLVPNKNYSEKTADFLKCFGSPNHKLNSFCWYFFIMTEEN